MGGLNESSFSQKSICYKLCTYRITQIAMGMHEGWGLTVIACVSIHSKEYQKNSRAQDRVLYYEKCKNSMAN